MRRSSDQHATYPENKAQTTKTGACASKNEACTGLFIFGFEVLFIGFYPKIQFESPKINYFKNCFF